MGYGHSYTCTECGKRGRIFLDIGMSYPEYCMEVMKKAREGKYGKKFMKAVTDYPDGYLDCSISVFACDCGGWKAVPRRFFFREADIDNLSYGSGKGESPVPVYEARHMCPRCGKKMHLYPEKDIKKLTCPKCGGKLDFKMRNFLWD